MVRMEIMKSREDWLKNRSRYIGGSDAAAIIGKNPWQNNIELWEEKTGRRVPEDISDKPYVKYGNQAEPSLRRLFALDFPEYKVGYKANNSYSNDKYPWARASLDGTLIERETGRKGILEIKTTSILQSMQKEKWKDRIPDNYYCQVLHYLAVTEWDFVVLKAQLKSEFEGNIYLQVKHYKIERADAEADIEYLMQEEARFWDCIQNDIKPPLLLPEI